MSRPVPPMYAKVARKVPPVGRKIPPSVPQKREVVVPVVEASAPSEETAPSEEEATSGEETEDSGEETEDSSGSALTKKAQRRLSKWSEAMPQRDLYRLAKSVGLDVRIRDSKGELIKKIKAALG